MHAVFLLLFILFATDLMAFVPMAALAAILFMVAWGMSEYERQKCGPAPDIEEGFLLAREARIRQIFGGRAAAHGNGGTLCAGTPAKFRISGHNLLGDMGGHFRFQKQTPYSLPRFLKGASAGVEGGEMFRNAGCKLIVVNERPVSVRSGGKARGHLHALLSEGRGHLA